MANTKISELPLYTGNTTGAYLVMNNSGQTTTYKVTRENIIGASGTSGTSGSSGSNGSSGSSGAAGASGSSGSSGTSGTSPSTVGFITTGSISTTQSITGSLNVSGSINRVTLKYDGDLMIGSDVGFNPYNIIGNNNSYIGFTKPTLIQALCWREIENGVDVKAEV